MEVICLYIKNVPCSPAALRNICRSSVLLTTEASIYRKNIVVASYYSLPNGVAAKISKTDDDVESVTF